MKKLFYRIETLILVLLVSLLFGCEQVEMNNEDARDLVIKTLSLPQKFHTEIKGSSDDPLGAGWKREKLVENGFIWEEGNWLYGYTLHITDKGKPYLIGEKNDPMNGKNILKFQAFDIDLNQITGIAINKEQKTATVRFSLKAVNISPISQLIEKNIDKTKESELIFRKFDNGWQLESVHNESAVELVKNIWWGK